jgi:4'-phosphopantetheinyl transferase
MAPASSIQMPHWADPHDRSPIQPGDIHVWHVDLDRDDPAGKLIGMISHDEQEQAKRRRSSVDGRRYAIGRASLRLILSRYVGGCGHALRLTREPRGRTVLDPSTSLSFSVANAGAVGLVAVAFARSIGVDLEPLSAAPHIAHVGDHYLPRDRVAAILAGPKREQDERWVRLWTEVEAYAKLDGRGLGDAESAEVLLDAREHRVQFRPTADHIATLIYTGPTARVAYLRFDPAEQPGGVDIAPR